MAGVKVEFRYVVVMVMVRYVSEGPHKYRSSNARDYTAAKS